LRRLRRNSKVPQAVRLGIVARARESRVHDEAVIRSLEMAEMPGMRGRDC
jgi:hypothetical protein